MNTLQKLLHGIHTLGLGTLLRVPLYTLQCSRLESRYPSPPPPQVPPTPGRLLSASAQPGGAQFTFQDGTLNILFLAPDFIFAGWNGAGMQPSYAVVKSDWPLVEVTLSPQGEDWRLEGPQLQVLVSPQGRLDLWDSARQPLRSFEPPVFENGGWRQRSPLADSAGVYGLGERTAGLDLLPGDYRLWNRDAGGAYSPGADPLYITMPLYLSLDEHAASLVFYDNPFDGVFSRQPRSAEMRLAGGPLRMYLGAGSPAALLERLTALTGRAPLPPRWALGYQQSRWGYRTQAQVEQVFHQFQAHRLPLSALVLDIDHMRGYRIFTPDLERFPDLPGFSRELAQAGVRLVAIVDPGVKVDSHFDLYRDGLAQDVFVRQPSGRPFHGVVWPGWSAFPDFTDPQARTWWGRQYARLIQQGITGIWHDMNEPTTFSASGEATLPGCLPHALDGQGGDHRQAHNVYGLLMNQAGHAGMLALRPGQRPFIVSRAGWVGMQRSAWSWTGDVETSWEALARTIPTVLGLGLCGQPYCGPDIGGFSGHPSPELFVRWFQLGAFLPFFRTHCVSFQPSREPWEWGPEVLELLRQQLELRYSLLPYWYTQAWLTSRSGAPLVRPLFWADPARPDLRRVDDAYLLGGDLLVAPVLRQGASMRRIERLPGGLWYDFYSGEPHPGDAGPITLEAPLERIPLLVRGGAILPIARGERLVLMVYAPAPGASAVSQLYSDSGDGTGPSRIEAFALAPTPSGGWTLLRQFSGAYPFPYSGVEVIPIGFSAGGLKIEI